MHDIKRRTFLKGSGLTAGAAATGAFTTWSRRVMGANEKVRLGFIGCGGITKAHFEALAEVPTSEVIAACDVDEGRVGQMVKLATERHGRPPQSHTDFRKLLENKDVDAVVVASPDHWHGLHTVYSCQAGKDVYVEKPISHNVVEGRAMVKAATRYERVVQVGTQQRSNKHYHDVIDYVRSGKLGPIAEVQTWNHYNRDGEPLPPDGEPPAGVDYDMWLGPAPRRAFNSKRFHGSWRYFRDYGGGYITDWNTHHQDIVHQAMNVWSPKSVVMDGYVAIKDRDMADTARVMFEYEAAQGPFLSTYTVRRLSSRAIDFTLTHSDHGIAFFGKEGTLVVTRSGWDVLPEDKKNKPRSEKGENKMAPHFANFVDAIKSRAKPTSDIETMHLSTLVNQIANISWFVGRKLYWDAKKESLFADAALKRPDGEANKFLGRQHRAPWKLPKV
jgi:predicted dehydrogenase